MPHGECFACGRQRELVPFHTFGPTTGMACEDCTTPYLVRHDGNEFTVTEVQRIAYLKASANYNMHEYDRTPPHIRAEMQQELPDDE